ncbi:MAG: hypothetical protein ABIP93_15995 [Gemmatimonadaceae bacterium]
MRWGAQVLHVMRKDLREDGWLLGGYAALVVTVTVQSLILLGTTNGPLQLLPYLVTLFGMIVTAAVVQTDSPTRPDAFWASRPFYASAMLAAKVTLAVIIAIALPLAGQLVVGSATDATLSVLAWYLYGSARSYSLWIIIAMVLAALTSDLKSFVIAVFGLALAVLVVILLQPSGLARIPPAMRPVMGVLSGLAGVALVAALYRTHGHGRRAWIAGATVCAGALIATAAPAGSVPAISEVARDVPRATLRITSTANETTGREILLMATLDSVPRGQHLTFVSSRMLVHLRNGHTLRFPMRGYHTGFGTRTLPLRQGLGELGASSGPTFIPVAAQLSGAQERAMAAGVARIVVEGRVGVLEPHIAGTLPLVEGATLARDGMRLRVEKWSHADGEATLRLVVASISSPVPPIDESGAMPPSTSFALLNERRGEILELQPRGVMGTEAMQVLPTRGFTYTTSELVLAPRGAKDLPTTDAWLHDAKLVVIQRKPLGSYAVSAEMVVPN